jgi:hypothetical protein
MNEYNTEEYFNKMLREKRSYNLKTLKVTSKDPVSNGYGGGGEFLGFTREFIQRKCENGEDVSWGSHDQLKFRSGMSVSDLEEFASKVAELAVNEFIKNINNRGFK